MRRENRTEIQHVAKDRSETSTSRHATCACACACIIDLIEDAIDMYAKSVNSDVFVGYRNRITSIVNRSEYVSLFKARYALASSTRILYSILSLKGSASKSQCQISARLDGAMSGKSSLLREICERSTSLTSHDRCFDQSLMRAASAMPPYLCASNH